LQWVGANSVITWTNNSNSTQNVWYVAFAYSTATRGQAFIQVNANGGQESHTNAVLGGLTQYAVNPLPAVPGNCFPSATRIRSSNCRGQNPRRLWQALVVDTGAMRGGLINVDAPNQTRLFELPWIASNPYPSFALLYRHTAAVPNDGGWRFLQKDIYSCVN
jgi:hypothetical protein